MRAQCTIFALLPLLLIRSAQLEDCAVRTTLLGSKKIYTCTNITSEFLASGVHHLNRSEWFHCVTCRLSTLTADALSHFEPKNRLLYLNASAAQMVTIDDFAFAPTTNLKLLLLRDNRIAHLTNATFASLGRLLQLDLSRNALIELSARVFTALKSLDILNLNGNRLQVLHSAAFNGLALLKYLYLSDNELVTLPPFAFAELPNLRILYVERNHLHRLHPLAFTNLQRLIYLYLNDNHVDALSPYNFKALSALVDLQMRTNRLAAITPSAFNGLRQLKFLYLGENNISAVAEHAFTGLDALIVLELAGNQLRTFELDALVDMPELRGLWLERNGIERLALAEDAQEHRNLASVDLKHNQLAFFNYKLLLGKIACLEAMYVGGNRFRCEFFVPMHDYFEDANVTLCLDAACDKNDTVWYTETLCKLSFNHSDEGNTSQAARIVYHNVSITIYLHLLCLIMCVFE